jgi:predicted secreted protein
MRKRNAFGRGSRLRGKLGLALIGSLLLILMVLPAASDSGVTVTEKDHGGHIQLSRDKFLYVRLEASPGTGYGWHIAKNDQRILKLAEKPSFEKPENPEPGATEVEVFHFQAEAAGNTTLELHYQRSWEQKAPPAKTFQIEVEVH